MLTTKSDTVKPSSSPNTKDPTKRLNNFDLRLQALSQDLNDSQFVLPVIMMPIKHNLIQSLPR